MFELTAKSGQPAISKGANLLGLTLSGSEMNELQSGNHISLADRSLSEIGSLFIMVSALADVNTGKAKSNVTLGDLPKSITGSQSSSGVPIYCWESNSQKMCLYLTMVNGLPAIRSCPHS